MFLLVLRVLGFSRVPFQIYVNPKRLLTEDSEKRILRLCSSLNHVLGPVGAQSKLFFLSPL